MEEDAPTRPKRRRGRIAAAIASACVAALIAGLWSQRAPIATHYVDRALAERGVPARYRITRFGVSSQRLEDVSIGDPAHPDLTADWIDLHLVVGFDGASLRGVAAGGVRLNAAVKDGRVSLGALDRLLPASSGGPLSLPDLDVALSDARVRLATPAGLIGVALDGAGNLADGFRGRLAAVSRGLAAGGCRTDRASAFVDVAIHQRRPSLTGPLRAERIACAGLTIDRAAIGATLAGSAALDRWNGDLAPDLTGLRASGVRAGAVRGSIGLDYAGSRSTGPLDLILADLATGAGTAGRVRLTGRYEADGARRSAGIEGAARVERLAAAGSTRARVARALAATAGTPVGPLAATVARSLDRALAGLDARASLAAAAGADGGAVRIADLDATSASGARLTQAAGAAIGYGWGARALPIDARLRLSGDGLPALAVDLRQPGIGAPLAGTVEMGAYAAGGARLEPLRVVVTRAAGGVTRVRTAVTLSGPLGGGRVERLALPIEAVIRRDGRYAVNAGCAPLAFDRLRLAGLDLGASRLTLCPSGAAMVSGGGGRALAGGATVASPRLAGRLGGAPLTLAADRVGFDLGQTGFTAAGVAARIGSGDAITRLDLASLDGVVKAGAVEGGLGGGAGAIAHVPIEMSAIAGKWRLADARLSIDGAMRVADADPAPRFEPMTVPDVRLTLIDGVIRAAGTLHEPVTHERVSNVAIRHDLAAGAGEALLDVPGIAFTEALQPERLTKLTLGIVANARGTVAGQGRIAWSPTGVTSTGDFATEKFDLAAAFGPVTGIAAKIHFDDLLGLHTPPGQVATVAEINPGIAVRDGVIRYQLLENQRIQVESGRWPFSGGTLTLAPTLLDFGQPRDRRMEFRVEGMNAADFVQQFDFKNIAVTGIFDGVMPIIFDQSGGRIEGGRLAVRKGGGTLAYVGEVSNAQLGMFGRLAFDALKSMRYDNLAIELDGRLDGELISRVLFDGTNETPKAARQKNGLLSAFSNLPFRFRITIRAPFRGLLNSAESLNDPRGLIGRSIATPPPLPGSAPATPTPIQPQ